MNEAILELLSRYLDGDLSAEEARGLEGRLAAEPPLRDELDRMVELRQAVRTLAAREQPPAELETLIEPLRRSAAAPQGVRPAVRWLAAAATLVLGVGVAIQIVRQNPAPTLPSTAPTARPDDDRSPDSGYFQLKPLPTRSADEGAELVGAADRLLASPLPMPELEAGRPMEVIGPLESPPPGRDLDAARSATEARPGRADAPRAEAPGPALGAEEGAAAERESSWAPAPPTEADVEVRQRARLAEVGAATRKSAPRAREPASDSLAAASSASARLELVIEGEVQAAAMVPSPPIEAGSYQLQLTVVGGQVRGCRGDGELGEQSTRDLCSAVLGIVLDRVEDGQHSATLVVPVS